MVWLTHWLSLVLVTITWSILWSIPSCQHRLDLIPTSAYHPFNKKNPTCILFSPWTACFPICTSSRFLEPRKWRATCSGSMLVTRASFQRRISYTRSFWLWTSIFHKNKVLANFSTWSGGGRGGKCHSDNVVQNPTLKFDIIFSSSMILKSDAITKLNHLCYEWILLSECKKVHMYRNICSKNRNTFYVIFFATKQWNPELWGFKKKLTPQFLGTETSLPFKLSSSMTGKIAYLWK